MSGYYHRNHHYTRPFSSQNSTTTSRREKMSSVDFIKVFVLGALYFAMFFSAGWKWFTWKSQDQFTLEPSYALCDAYGDKGIKHDDTLYIQCQNVIDTSYAKDIPQKCAGYMNSLTTCLKSTHHAGKCPNEVNNVESCASGVVKAAFDKWEGALPSRRSGRV
jgi:hypothetical protein